MHTRRKSAKTFDIKHYCDCRLLVSETFFFFYAKKEDKIFCFWLCSLTLRTGISKFATKNITKFLANRIFLLLFNWDVEISGNYQWKQSLSR